MRNNENGFEAVVAAGGDASRCDGCPKSLHRASGRALIAVTLEQLRTAGVRRVLVYNNRADMQHAFDDVMRGFPEAHLRADDGVDSTFLLVRDSLPVLADHFLFVYGHAPRPSSHLRGLMALPAPAGTTVKTTSMRRPMPVGARYFEPPYWLHRESIEICDAQTWTEYFTSEARVADLALDGPGEPNTNEEMRMYVQWVLERMAD